MYHDVKLETVILQVTECVSVSKPCWASAHEVCCWRELHLWDLARSPNASHRLSTFQGNQLLYAVPRRGMIMKSDICRAKTDGTLFIHLVFNAALIDMGIDTGYAT